MRRRLFPASLLCVALLAGCGDDSDSSDSSSDSSTVVTAAASTDGTTSASGDTESNASADVPTIPADCPAVPETTVPETTVAEPTVPDASFPPGKPAVEIPTELPEELVVTDLIEGTGDAAKAGDLVTVNYVGVRSVDGTEFDNSYDTGQTFPVTLGTGGVIAGWDQGLIGIKAGGRRQLDIPADLAYGDTPQGDIIQAGDALTFIVDAVSVVAGLPIPEAPKVDIPTSVGATEATTTELVDGDRCLIALPGQIASVQIILYRGDTGEELQSTWTTGQAVDIALDETTIQGLVDGIVGMGVGGRRLLVLPPELGFGAEGNTEMGLEADTDIVLVVDLVNLG